MSKVCSCCGKELPIESFYIRKYTDKNGVQHEYYDSKCKKCKNLYSRNYNRANKDKLDTMHKQWRDQNKDKISSYRRNWRGNNPEYNKTWSQNNKESVKLFQVKYNYNLTKEEYEALPKSCEVCGSTDNLCIDHNHETGLVRGVLCSRCNSALGLLRENSSIILRLASYITEKQ